MTDFLNSSKSAQVTSPIQIDSDSGQLLSTASSASLPAEAIVSPLPIQISCDEIRNKLIRKYFPDFSCSGGEIRK